MDLKSYVKKTLAGACIYFSIITLLYGLLVALIYTEAEEILLEGSRIYFFFLFSLMFSAANSVLKIESVSSFLRRILHYFITVLAFLFCVLLPATNDKTGASFIIVGLAALTLIYVLIFVAFSLIRSSVSRKQNQKEEYKKHFSK
ncbi:MAG: hypothetical protein IKB02_06105 [Clostridia bacterium]|nr:hypothetical protein [Clostridia bacterium]